MGMLISKLSLIFIVASWKLYSEQANRGREIQIWGHRRPLIYRSLNSAKCWTKNWLKKALTTATLTCNYP